MDALLENEEKYRRLFESSPESITLVGLDSTILDCNEATAVIEGPYCIISSRWAFRDAILLKPGPLTEEEWLVMRKHPVFAYNLLSNIPLAGFSNIFVRKQGLVLTRKL